MNQFFISELVEEKLICLIINDNSVLVDFVSQQIKIKNFDFLVLNTQEIDFLINLDKVLKNQPIYKIFWLVGTDLNKIPSQAYQILQKWQRNLIFISPWFLVLKNQNVVFKDWQQEVYNFQFKISQFLIFLPQATFYLIKDLFDFSFAVWQNIFLNQGVFYDPQINFFPSQKEDLIKILEKCLVFPLEEKKFLFYGQKTFSSELINKVVFLYYQYYQQKIKVQKILIETNEEVPSGFKKFMLQNQNSNLSKIIVEQLPSSFDFSNKTSSLPQPEPQPEFFSSPILQDFKPVLDKPMAKPIFVKSKNNDLSLRPLKLAEKITDSSLNQNDNLSDNPTQQIEKEIQDIFETKRQTQTQNRKVKKAVKTLKTKHKNLRKKRVFIAGLGLLSIASLILSLVLFYYLNFLLIKTRLNQQNNSGKLVEFFDQQSSQWLFNSLKNQNQIYQFWPQIPFLKSAQLLENFLAYNQQILVTKKAIDQLSFQVLANFLGQENSQDGQEKIKTLALSFNNQYQNLSFQEINLKQQDLKEIIDQDNIDVLLDKTVEAKKQILIMERFFQLLPQILGYDKPKTYAVVVQNSQEIRPTGGFIEAIALIDVSAGKIIQKQVYDIYQIDKLLRGKKTPPDDLHNMLGESEWLTRDANWFADFPTTSKEIVYFIKNSLDKEVDGVIAINDKVLAGVLEAIGQIDLPENNEIISEQNLAQKIFIHSENQLYEKLGQTGYLAKIFDIILAKLVQVNPDQFQKLVTKLNQNINQNNIFLFNQNKDIQDFFQSVFWSGAVISPACPLPSENNCLVESFFAVDTNVGVNRANFQVEKEVEHYISLTKNEIKHQRIIVFDNKAASNAWPSGDFKNYLRFYVDKNSILDEIKINNQSLSLDRLIITNEQNKQVWGFYLLSPINQKTKVEIFYHTPVTNFKSYNFFDQQQSGSKPYPFRLVLNYDSNLKPKIIAPAPLISSNELVFSQIKNSNYFISVVFE